MSVSASNTIRKAYAKAGVFEYTDTGTSAKMDMLALDLLNDILSEWSINEELNPGNLMIDPFVPANMQYIKISSDATESNVDVAFDVAQILDISMQYGPSLMQPVFAMREVSLPEYNRISVKGTPSIPYIWSWDQQNPTSKVYLFPENNGGLYARMTVLPLLSAATPTATIALPPWYSSGLTACLALRLLHCFPRESTTLETAIVAEMNSALKHIKERNRHARVPNNQYRYYGGQTENRQGFFTSSWNNVTQ